jgi:hypothetical protein
MTDILTRLQSELAHNERAWIRMSWPLRVLLEDAEREIHDLRQKPYEAGDDPCCPPITEPAVVTRVFPVFTCHCGQFSCPHQRFVRIQFCRLCDSMTCKHVVTAIVEKTK